MRPVLVVVGFVILFFSIFGMLGLIPYTQGLSVSNSFSACHLTMQVFPTSGPSPLGATITMNSLNCNAPIVYTLNFGDGSAPVSQVSNNVQWFIPHFYYCPSGQTTGSVSFTASGSNSDNNGNGGSNTATVIVNCGTGTTTVVTTTSVTTTSVTTTTGATSVSSTTSGTTTSTTSTCTSNCGGNTPSFWTGIWALALVFSVVAIGFGFYLPSGRGHR